MRSLLGIQRDVLLSAMKGYSSSQSELSRPKVKLSHLRNVCIAHSSKTCAKPRRGLQVGDPLEIKLLQATGWIFRDSHADGSAATSSVYPPGNPSGGVNILQRFDFTAESARCTVVACPSAGGPAQTHVKGSPEVLRQLVDPATVPEHFDAVLEGLAREGFRCAISPPWYHPATTRIAGDIGGGERHTHTHTHTHTHRERERERERERDFGGRGKE